MTDSENCWFFQENYLKSEHDNQVEIDQFVEVHGTSEIEFISQNQVEAIANREELTNAVYDRIKNLHYDDIDSFENKTKEFLATIDELKTVLLDEHQAIVEEEKIARQINELQKIVDHYSSEEYKKLTNEIKKHSDSEQKLLASKNRYTALKTSLNDVLNQYRLSSPPENEYEDEIAIIISGVDKLIQKKRFVASDTLFINYRDEVASNKSKLEAFMASQGVSEEDADEYERALERIPKLRAERSLLIQRISDLNRRKGILLTAIDDLSTTKVEFENFISSSLTPLNQKLKNIDKNVADIRFEYKFNVTQALDKVHTDFEGFFSQYRPSEHSTRRNAVRDYLFCLSPWNVDSFDDYNKALDEHGTNANAKSFIRMIFEDRVNFEIYKLIIKARNNDILLHKSIVGYYDEKEFKRCSFGQRCTAVIVALLMFGSKPIIIDEPEAHLDSKLIAEYLINLIKERKSFRQIIFATHNANFVVNGDAELIHCLEIGSDNLSKTCAATVENIGYRDKLLSLEGGEDAFKRRDRKLLKEI